MRYSIRKRIIAISAVLAVILLLLGGYAGYTYYMAATGKAKISPPKFTLSPSATIKLGDVVTASATVKCPWGHFPNKATVSVSKGLQVVLEPTIRKTGTSWGSSLWDIEMRVQPFRTGKMQKSTCEIQVASEKDGKTEFKTLKSSIPEFDVLAVDTGKDKKLYIAKTAKETTMTERNPWIMPIIAVLSLIGTIVFLVLWLRKRQTIMESVVLPPWTLALSLLENLRGEMRNGRVRGEVCVGKLTDIVRNYIEQRFEIHAPSQTTHEFLSDLDSGSSELQHEQRLFLRNFLTAADLVKFANLPADKELLEAAINKAETLVESTKLDETEKAVNSNQ